MKKILILNGGPRKNNNTAKLLASAREGAVSAGASVECWFVKHMLHRT